MDKKVDIRDRYSSEISNIKHRLNQLKKERIYELTGAKIDGLLSNHIIKLERDIIDLIDKVEYDKKSILELSRDLSEQIGELLTERN